MTIDFISSKDSDKTRTMHTMSDNKEILIGNETDEIIEETFDSLLQRYQSGLERKWEGMNLFLTVLIYCIINPIK